MIEIGVHYAKTHFSEILAQVEKGKEFRITNRGREVAVLKSSKEEKKKIFYETLKELREEAKSYNIPKKEIEYIKKHRRRNLLDDNT